MKNIIFILLITVLASCSKEHEPYCKQVLVTNQYYIPVQGSSLITDTLEIGKIYCDEELQHKLELDGTFTVAQMTNNTYRIYTYVKVIQ